MFKASEAISYDWTNVFRCAYYYFKNSIGLLMRHMLRFVREGWHDIGQTLDNTLATSEIRNMYMDDLSTEQ